jgi:hypothetical protein
MPAISIREPGAIREHLHHSVRCIIFTRTVVGERARS